jgi:sporulation protein YlmC with PRC-barrel domain
VRVTFIDENLPQFVAKIDSKFQPYILQNYAKYYRNVYKQIIFIISMDKRAFRTLLGKQIVTKEGRKLGFVKDITFEAKTGELIHLVLKDLTSYTANLSLERTKANEALIPYNAIIAIGDFIVVSEEDLV